jgi:hypothetical protein
MIDFLEDSYLFFKRKLQSLCEFATHHHFRKLEGWTEKLGTDPDDYRPEYYWKCRLCRKTFWNYKDEN